MARNERHKRILKSRAAKQQIKKPKVSRRLDIEIDIQQQNDQQCQQINQTQEEENFEKQQDQFMFKIKYEAKINELEDKLRKQNEKFKSLSQSFENVNSLLSKFTFKDIIDENMLKFYTGLPNYEVFQLVYNTVCDHVPRSDNKCKLTKQQELILVLMRLRLGLLEQDLAYRFGINQSNVSRIFTKWIVVIAERLSFLVKWPERSELLKTMPSCFLENFKTCVVILDCFEIFIEKSANLTARAQTYSSYKSNNTVKVLLGITPQGTISYVSEPWGGRTSDVYLTENCGILQNLLPGDTVIADRGFTIGDAVGLYCAELRIPEFTRGKSQLNQIDVDKTRDLARVRIHVERVIGLMRNKFTILQNILPIKMVMKKANGVCFNPNS